MAKLLALIIKSPKPLSSNLNFSKAILVKTYFAGGRRSGPKFKGTNFTGANLEGANLRWLFIHSSSFFDASLKGVDLIGTRLVHSDFSGTIIDDQQGLP